MICAVCVFGRNVTNMRKRNANLQMFLSVAYRYLLNMIDMI